MQISGVQEQAVQPGRRRPRIVSFIAGNRRAEIPSVRPDLVGSTRLDSYFHEIAPCKPFKALEARTRRLTVLSRDHPVLAAAVANLFQRHIDIHPRLVEMTVEQRQVTL